MGLDKPTTGPGFFGWPIKAQARRPLLLSLWTSLLRTGRVSVAIRRLVRLSWRGSAGQGPAISYETGTRPTGFSYVYKYQLATHIE